MEKITVNAPVAQWDPNLCVAVTPTDGEDTPGSQWMHRDSESLDLFAVTFLILCGVTKKDNQGEGKTIMSTVPH